MQAKGTDGTSRGQFCEGVNVGEKMLDFIPWNEAAQERTLLLEPWLCFWMGDNLEFLDPAGWFTRGHNQLGGEYDDKGFWHHKICPGTFVWTPLPTAVVVALEDLRKSRIKRQDSTHFFICSCLLTPEWLKQLWKTADIIFQVSPGTPGWPANMFELLTIGIVFPFLPKRPWQLKGTPKMFYLVRQVQKMFKEKILDSGDFLRELLLECQRLHSMPADVVRRMLYFKSGSDVSRKPIGKQGGRKRKRPRGSSKVEKGVGHEALVRR
jgi:hypothetical protein